MGVAEQDWGGQYRMDLNNLEQASHDPVLPVLCCLLASIAVCTEREGFFKLSFPWKAKVC